MVSSHATFDGPPPTADQIAAAITRICGLELTVTPAPPGGIADLYDLNATLAFTADPAIIVELRAYRPGAMRDWCKTHMAGMRVPADTVNGIEGMHESEGKRTVHLQWPLTYDPTLWGVTLLALESLGGQLEVPSTEAERATYGRTLTPADLRRKRRNRRVRTLVEAVVLTPLVVVYWLLLLVTAPIWLVIAARRMDRNLKKATQRYLFDGDPGYRQPEVRSEE